MVGFLKFECKASQNGGSSLYFFQALSKHELRTECLSQCLIGLKRDFFFFSFFLKTAPRGLRIIDAVEYILIISCIGI